MDQCSKCRRRRPVPGDGPLPCTSLWLGEGPGWHEDRKLIPFVGKSGRELNYQYLPMSGLSRDLVRITNAIKCRQGKKDGDEPFPEDVAECARHHLPGELRAANPDYIVTMGAVALSLFGEDLDLEMVHGFPLTDRYYGGWTGTVFPCYHPAAGIRKSEYMLRCQQDFHNLWLWRHGKLVTPVDEFPNPDYRLLRTTDDLACALDQHAYSRGFDLRGSHMGVDTETDKGKFWCVTFSFSPGTGCMIHADNHELLRQFHTWARRERPLWIFHNWLYDGPVLAQADISGYRWTDTMESCYTLQSISQSLKVNAYRLCGMVMQEYADLVRPYSIQEATSYLTLVAGMELPDYIDSLPWKPGKRVCSGAKKYGGKHDRVEVVFDSPVSQNCPGCDRLLEPPKMEHAKGGISFIWDRAARILREMESLGSDPITRWDSIPYEERSVISSLIGEMPEASITQVPESKVIYYACRDSDATLRIRPHLTRLQSSIGHSVRRVM